MPSGHHAATKVMKRVNIWWRPETSVGNTRPRSAAKIYVVPGAKFGQKQNNLVRVQAQAVASARMGQWSSRTMLNLCISGRIRNCGCNLSLYLHLSDSSYAERSAARILLHLPPLIYFLAQSSSKNLHGTKYFVNLWYASFRSGEFVRQRTPLYMGCSRRDSGIVAYEHTLHSPQAIK